MGAMGRIFETRKATMFARWNKMAKVFTRISKDIAISVKAGGPDPAHNAALRRALQNARAANMPKDKVEGAIKRASGQDQQAYEIVLYEGYGPHGVAMVVETATDNVVRTVANVRLAFKTHGGNLATAGEKGEKQLVLRCGFSHFGEVQAALEERKQPVISAESEYVAQTPVQLPEEQAQEVLKLVDALEQDEDVQRVFHNLA